MDKNKSRTDLLAAGRKKLQQFRQKKDTGGKGSSSSGSSHGKSSKKSGKSDSSKPTGLPEVLEGESFSRLDSLPRDIDFSVSGSTGNVVDPDSDVVPVDVPSGTEMGVARNVGDSSELHMDDKGDIGTDSSVGIIVDPPAIVAELGNTDIPSVEEVKEGHDSGANDGDIPAVADDINSGHQQQLMIQDKVAQEADGSGPSQIIDSSDIVVDKVKEPGVSEHHETTDIMQDPSLEQAGILEANSGFTQVGGNDELMSAAAPTTSGGLSTSVLAVPDVGLASEVTCGLSNVENLDSVSISGHHGNNREDNDQESSLDAEPYSQQYMSEDSYIFIEKGQERPLSPQLENTPEGCHLGYTQAISFPQLVEAIKRLNEDDFRLLLNCRESDSNADLDPGNLISKPYGVPDSCERLKEELFLATVFKDFLQTQLDEQSVVLREHELQFRQLNHEIPMLRASLEESHNENALLTEDLSSCKSELHATVSEKEDLSKELHSAKAEVADVRARADELQGSMERSLIDFASLSKELASCKDVLATLEKENGNLNETLSSFSEEKNKLSEENHYFRQENDNLLKELAQCKNLVAALQEEVSGYSRDLELASEERNKIEREKEYLASGHEKLSSELFNLKDVAEGLRLENANLNGKLFSVVEERHKLDEERSTLLQENDKLSSELLSLGEKFSSYQEEQAGLAAELKEMTVQLDQLSQENVSLASSLEMHKAELKGVGEGEALRSPPRGTSEDGAGSMDIVARDHEGATDDLLSEVPTKQDGEAAALILEGEGHARIPLSELSELEVLDDASACHARIPLSELSELEVLDDASAFVVITGDLEEAAKLLHQLEKVLESMQSYSASMHGSGDKIGSPVSQLIQAFESKDHRDEKDATEIPTPEDGSSSSDRFAFIKEVFGTLKKVHKKLTFDAENYSLLLKREQESRSHADVSLGKLKVELESVLNDFDDVEASNIELLVCNEAIKHYTHHLKERNINLEDLCETLLQQNNTLKEESCELGEHRSHAQLAVLELQKQIQDMQESSNQMVAMLREQLENLQREAAIKASVEQEWNDTGAQILEAVGRLDSSTGILHSSDIGRDIPGALNLSCRQVTLSVNAAIELVEDLKEKLAAAQAGQEASFNLLKEEKEKYSELLEKNVVANATLEHLYSELRQLLTEFGSEDFNGIKPYPVDYGEYEAVVEQLQRLLAERVELHTANSKLSTELMSRTRDIEELDRRAPDLSLIQNVIQDVEGLLKPEDVWTELDESPVSRLASLMSSLVPKYKEVEEQHRSSRKELDSKVGELTELQEKINQLTAVNHQQDNEVCHLKQQLSQAEEALVATRSELNEKANELVLSEQRVSSVREKLGIAVAKGKGLVGQRDALKQSLTETSNELEKCSQELQLKDARLQEVEAMLKTYLEAGEHVEALESELSYIRNSATALRESFLLKDSVLLKIEEILEDLELPDDFHSRDIIEKVEWLARTATVNSLPSTDVDQRGLVGGSYPDAGHAVMDSWKGEVHPGMIATDELRRKYEDLQNKFYGLAEQNEMLEQSLVERNQLVQRWEELLDGIDMPSHMRSMEPDQRVEWLGSALSQAFQERDSLLQKIDECESNCSLLSSDLEESQHRTFLLSTELQECQKRKTELEMELESATQQREAVFERLDFLTHEHEKLSAIVVQYEIDVKTLEDEVTNLEEKLVKKDGVEEHAKNIDSRISRMMNLVSDALQQPDAGLHIGGSDADYLELLLEKLIEDHLSTSSKSRVLGDVRNACLNTNDISTRDLAEYNESDVRLRESDKVVIEETNVDMLQKHFDEIVAQLKDVQEERDRYVELHQSLAGEVELLNKRSLELQELLNLEEQKSNSAREKLNVAVRKGKSLVQQRDGLKKNVEELNNEVEQLNSDIRQRDSLLAEFEEKMKTLTSYSEKVGDLEYENSLLKNQLSETEHILKEKGHTLTMVLDTLRDIDIGGEFNVTDPSKKVEHLGKLCRDLREAVASLDQDSKKSRRAAELLLAELNEVQDRNDHLQEELLKATDKLAELSKERELTGAANSEALFRLEKLSTAHSEEKMKLHSELTMVRSAIKELHQRFSHTISLLPGLLQKDLEFLRNLEAGVECLKRSEVQPVVNVPLFNSSKNAGLEDNLRFADFSPETDAPDHFNGNLAINVQSSIQKFMKDIGATEITLQEHSMLFHQHAKNLSELIGACHREMTSKNQSFEALKEELKRVESVHEHKEREAVFLRRSVRLLYEVCTNTLKEIESTKGEALSDVNSEGGLESSNFADSELLSRSNEALPSEEFIKSAVDKLVLAVKDLANLKAEISEGDKKEMKLTISNLRTELLEKDAQKDKICQELVSQIKKAEGVARGYSVDLQTSKTRLNDLEKQVALAEEDRSLLKQRVKELQDGQSAYYELQESVRSLTETLASKDNEIESLMQALDEEEVEMEGFRGKIEELENVLKQKNSDIENLETSRAKVLKKLSVTVGKFDELHQFSESLLSEVEKLQLQVQDRDAEISFLRQEVTRCTNEVLTASQMSSKRSSDEVHEILTWLDTLLSQTTMQDMKPDDGSDAPQEKEILQKKVAAILSELEDFRLMAQSKDTLLRTEMSKVEELKRREEILEKVLREKESQLNMLEEEVGDSARPAGSTSEILEVEPLINKRTMAGPASQVRSLRKVNSDQVAIAIDVDSGDTNRMEYEDDDKVHGFKSLTTSRVVPKFTRPVSDIVDGLWVSCDRALMRQPAARLGIIIYWALLHVLLATFVF